MAESKSISRFQRSGVGALCEGPVLEQNMTSPLSMPRRQSRHVGALPERNLNRFICFPHCHSTEHLLCTLSYLMEWPLGNPDSVIQLPQSTIFLEAASMKCLILILSFLLRKSYLSGLTKQKSKWSCSTFLFCFHTSLWQCKTEKCGGRSSWWYPTNPPAGHCLLVYCSFAEPALQEATWGSRWQRHLSVCSIHSWLEDAWSNSNNYLWVAELGVTSIFSCSYSD